MEHELRCWPEHYAVIDAGTKTVELRLNDRPYQRGDALLLREWEPVENGYTGRQLRVRVTHVLIGGPWLSPGYVAMSIRLMGEDGRARVQEDFRKSYDDERKRADKLEQENTTLSARLQLARLDIFRREEDVPRYRRIMQRLWAQRTRLRAERDRKSQIYLMAVRGRSEFRAVVRAQRAQLDDAHAALTAAGVPQEGSLGHRVRLLAAQEGGR